MLIKPSMNFVLKWINVFFLPAFIVLPLSQPITFVEVAKIAGTFVLGFLALFIVDVYLMRILVYSYEHYWKKRSRKSKAASLATTTDDDDDYDDAIVQNNHAMESNSQRTIPLQTILTGTTSDVISIASSALDNPRQDLDPETQSHGKRSGSFDSQDESNVVELIEMKDLNRKRLDITTINLAELRAVKTEPTKKPVHRPENPFADSPSSPIGITGNLSIPERVYYGQTANDTKLDFLHHLSRPHTIDLAVNSSYLTTTVTQNQVPQPDTEDENHNSTDPKEQEEELAILATLLPLAKSTMLFITKYIDWLIYGLMFLVSLPFYYISLIHLMLPYQLSISILVYYVALLMPEKYPQLKKVGYHPILFLTGIILFIFFIGSLIYYNGKPVGFLVDLRYFKTGKKYSNLFNGERMYNNGEIAPTDLHVTKLDKWPGCGDVLSSLMDVSIVALSLPMFSFRRDFIDNFGFIVPVLLVSCAASYLLYPMWSYAIGISPSRSIGFIGRFTCIASKLKEFYMLVDDNSRLIFLPKEITGSYQLISLLNESFILYDLNLYQLRAMETNEFPSSFIIEKENDQGAILNNSDHRILVASKYNLNFKLLLLLQRTTRSKSLENLGDDELSSIIDIDHNGKGVPLELVEKYLENETLWDIINEGGESYYKFNSLKCLNWLQIKVDKLVKVHLNYSSSSIVRQFKKDYQDITQQSLIELHVRRFAVGFITHAYNLETVYEPLLSLYDFSSLDEMIETQKATLKQRQLVETNLRATSDTSSSLKKRPNSTTGTKGALKRNKKATLVKVAVGKGALDSFFKKS
ncbi:uncharacterized protein KQ657_000841 [Scheffersomyces spartinae]|uniref:Ribonuclease H2 subunit B wHTH domain-containing protein n=1 Tax=Scheffersomyces spartinae TaxID=45513 RepID=A0A9P8AI27_9ASCO|nr:uncharacterized protein KQ657_000841 [Scheffersomyces spartinae]KAG7193423.1 hypothetical protein KQ657_000841 [Scheffersomyces spartinae]